MNFFVVVLNLDVSKEFVWLKLLFLFIKLKVFDVGGEKIGVVGFVL